METHDSQRRTLLRGSLAAGIAWVLAGCDRKPQTSTTGISASQSSSSVASSGTSTVAVAPADAGATPKVAKAIAQYQEQPKGEQKCVNCANFIGESRTCKVVEGAISPDGWCIYWQKKA